MVCYRIEYDFWGPATTTNDGELVVVVVLLLRFALRSSLFGCKRRTSERATHEFNVFLDALYRLEFGAKALTHAYSIYDAMEISSSLFPHALTRYPFGAMTRILGIVICLWINGVQSKVSTTTTTLNKWITLAS